MLRSIACAMSASLGRSLQNEPGHGHQAETGVHQARRGRLETGERDRSGERHEEADAEDDGGNEEQHIGGTAVALGNVGQERDHAGFSVGAPAWTSISARAPATTSKAMEPMKSPVPSMST